MKYENKVPISKELQEYLDKPLINHKEEKKWYMWFCPLNKEFTGWKFGFTFKFWKRKKK